MLPFILLAVLLVTEAHGNTECPDGWESFEGDNTCFKIFNAKMSFANARKTCKAENAELVKINNAGHGDLVASFLDRDSVWIGVWDGNKDGKFTNVDDSELGSFRPWQNGEPDNERGDERCVVWNVNRGWSKIQCTTELPFICSFKRCPEGWVNFGNDNRCFKKFKTEKDYFQAKKICMDENGMLPKVTNAAEQDFVNDLVSNDYNWLGLYDEGNDGHYKYLDGSEMGEYHPWVYGNGYKFRCAALLRKRGVLGWRSVCCGYRYPFACSAVFK